MSAFYDLASLVLVPSGYKASKVYAQKPLTTDGQLTFSRASTATRVNSAGLIETVSSNVPRLDYLGSTCPKLLLEPSRTNKLTQSDSFTAGVSGTTVTPNNAISPDGTQNAALISGTSGYAYIGASNNFGNGVTTTFSAFIKYKQGSGSVAVGIGGSFNAYLFVNGLNGSNPTVTGSYGGATNGSVGIVAYPNGWYRVYLTATYTGTPGYQEYQVNSNNTNTQFWHYNSQIEDGAYMTSPIKTTGAAVTRLADACSKTGISSLIGQTEGTIFWEGSVNTLGAFPQLCDLNADGNKFIQIYNSLVSGVPRIGLYIQNVSVLLNTGNIASISYDTNFKFALAYKNNDYAAYLNGNLVYTNTTIGVPPTSNFGLAAAGQSAESSGKKVNQALLFKTRLPNAQLAELTSL